MLSDSKIAIFCSGDNNYIPQMIMALTIACKKNRFDPFIITDASESELKLIHDAGINTIKVDLKEKFDRHNENWPSQSFWWCYGPSQLHNLGYEYSIFIDADVMCVQELDMSIFNDELEIAARPLETANEFNSGVVLFNNEKMVKKKLYTRFLEAYTPMSTLLFKEYHGGMVHDQQVLSALGSKQNQFTDYLNKLGTFNITELGVEWNYQFHRAEGQNDEFMDMDYEQVKEKIYFAHFLLSRPWLHHSEWGGTHGLFRTEDFPHGWVVKTRHGEPNPEIRLQFVMDWREEVRMIESHLGIQLFNDFGRLEDMSL
jgi:lipopolysaccharide biosynthesis glycosyltransferase